MIVVKIELWPLGIEANAQVLGEIEIVNDGTGTPTEGNYNINLYKWNSRRTGRGGIWRKGKIVGFPRLTRGPYDLLLRGLLALVGNRNKAEGGK